MFRPGDIFKPRKAGPIRPPIARRRAGTTIAPEATTTLPGMVVGEDEDHGDEPPLLTELLDLEEEAEEEEVREDGRCRDDGRRWRRGVDSANY